MEKSPNRSSDTSYHDKGFIWITSWGANLGDFMYGVEKFALFPLEIALNFIIRKK